MDFRALPSGPRITLRNLTVPACLIGQAGDLVTTDLTIADGVIASEPETAGIDMAGAMALPSFVDMHTHLDKGHIWARAPNPDGTFLGALTTVERDRTANWAAEDVRRRMDFSLRCAFAHGTRAVRTHLDSIAPQDDISWPVFAEVRDDWASRVDLQAACLASCESVEPDGSGNFAHTADLVARYGGVLGMVTYPVPDLDDRLRCFFGLAEERGLEVDFHVDETMDPASATLRQIASVANEVGFERPITVGHCCSLATQAADEADRTLDLVADVGINVVSLPMCNLYLQDRHADRTPRRRGITLVHEMRDRGINVAFASDNTRDPFYAYGDLDMLEVMREATRIGHLDHSRSDWVTAFSHAPAKACAFAEQDLSPGAPADLVIFRARSWTELFARPQFDRIVLRGGRTIARDLPDYAELDDLMELS
ncbi:MAG: cytosine deaminase [Pseudomonadota bacterium]